MCSSKVVLALSKDGLSLFRAHHGTTLRSTRAPRSTASTQRGGKQGWLVVTLFKRPASGENIGTPTPQGKQSKLDKDREVLVSTLLVGALGLGCVRKASFLPF